MRASARVQFSVHVIFVKLLPYMYLICLNKADIMAIWGVQIPQIIN